MRTPNCAHYDFAFETYEGEKRIYCAVRGANVKQGECAKCPHKKPRAKGEKQEVVK